MAASRSSKGDSGNSTSTSKIQLTRDKDFMFVKTSMKRGDEERVRTDIYRNSDGAKSEPLVSILTIFKQMSDDTIEMKTDILKNRVDATVSIFNKIQILKTKKEMHTIEMMPPPPPPPPLLPPPSSVIIGKKGLLSRLRNLFNKLK